MPKIKDVNHLIKKKALLFFKPVFDPMSQFNSLAPMFVALSCKLDLWRGGRIGSCNRNFLPNTARSYLLAIVCSARNS
jgi:hypothetical protein